LPSRRDYPTDATRASLQVMAELWTILRDYNEYMVLIGGWVPFFLLQRYGEGSVEHVGSLDIDLALNAQAIPVDAYETILDRLQDRGYHHRVDRQGRPIPFSFERAVVVEGGSRVVVQVDLLAPQYGGTGPRQLGIRWFKTCLPERSEGRTWCSITSRLRSRRPGYPTVHKSTFR